MKATVFILSFMAFVHVVLGMDSVNSGWLPYPQASTVVYTTTNLVTNWDLVKDCSPPLDYDLWTENILALGYDGPLSSFGPLGSLGPIGSNEWDPSKWISGSFTWDEWSDLFLDGPLSEEGPLGEAGPFTPKAYYQGEVFLEDPFAPFTRGMGVWGVLGPIGPLGAVGALGALGPVGATGYEANPNGQYYDSKGMIHTNYLVPYNETNSRLFDLYEQYTPVFAAPNWINNPSFLVEGDCCATSPNSCLAAVPHNYPILSDADQLITVVVVPTSTEEDVSNIMFLNLLQGKNYLPVDGNHTLVNSRDFINFIQFTAHANDRYIIQVFPAPGSERGTYRLYVTGSTSYLNQYNFHGSYLRQVTLH